MKSLEMIKTGISTGRSAQPPQQNLQNQVTYSLKNKGRDQACTQ